ncbi:Na(+)/H(+) antiporter subunit F1 [Jeotgalicoccus sp. WY2]|uniref:Na(+)/H(+) antiporter subunit F1 n=1 Tax=Jeotgalicoccus sp. WY2 TaxID=2708346 RepID=UPI0035304F1B
MIYRVLKGPTLHDRVITLDAFGVTLMGMIGLVSIALDTSYLLVVIMLIGMIGFIATIGFAKFLEKGVIIENDRDNNS